MTLEGKTVLISGAARRVGRSLALAVARHGGDLIIHYGKSQAEAECLKAEIEAMGHKAHLLQADLSDPQQVAGIIPRALQQGSLFALVNNAAVFESLSWQDTSLEDWNRHLAINLTAPFLLSQAFARSLEPGSTGRIINLLDWRALRPGADHLPYTVSKASLAALTRSLAVAFSPQVTVNGIALGAILPPGDGVVDKDILAPIPEKRWGKLEEVEETVLFLLDGPSYITGEIIYLDGGRHLV